MLAALWFGGPLRADEGPSEPSAQTKGDDLAAEQPLTMSDAVACRSIEGYEQYEALPEAALTADEKMLIYYRPLNYWVEEVKKGTRIHLVQDGRIRRRGSKVALFEKKALLDYEVNAERRPGPVYLRNTISLKGLKPGDYVFEIILHDKLNPDATSTQLLPFRVIAPKLPAEQP